MVSIIIFSLPAILFLLSVINVRSGKTEKIRWKLPTLLLLVLVLVSIVIQYYYLQTYDFPLLQTSIESWIGLGIAGLLLGIILIINVFITKTIGKNASKTFHDPKLVNNFALSVAFFVFIIVFFAAPTGKKIAFAHSINQAIQVTEQSHADTFKVVLVRSEQECLRRTGNCRNAAYSNLFFVKNNGDKVEDLQVEIRALDTNNQEMRVINSAVMSMEPGELRMVVTEETNNNSSVWNQYSFQTAYQITNYQYKIVTQD